MDPTLQKIANELPLELASALAAGAYEKVAAEVLGLPGGISEYGTYLKVGTDLMARLQERRQIVKGLLHLSDLGG